MLTKCSQVLLSKGSVSVLGGGGRGGVGVKKLHFVNKQATVKSVSEFD